MYRIVVPIVAVIMLLLPGALYAQSVKPATIELVNDTSWTCTEFVLFNVESEEYSKNLLRIPLASGQSIRVPIVPGAYYLFSYIDLEGEEVEINADYVFASGDIAFWQLTDDDLYEDEMYPYDYYDPYAYEDPYAYL